MTCNVRDKYIEQHHGCCWHVKCCTIRSSLLIHVRFFLPDFLYSQVNSIQFTSATCRFNWEVEADRDLLKSKTLITDLLNEPNEVSGCTYGGGGGGGGMFEKDIRSSRGGRFAR